MNKEYVLEKLAQIVILAPQQESMPKGILTQANNSFEETVIPQDILVPYRGMRKAGRDRIAKLEQKYLDSKREFQTALYGAPLKDPFPGYTAKRKQIKDYLWAE